MRALIKDVLCGDCGQPMRGLVKKGRNVVECANPGCKNHKRKWEAPEVRLKPYRAKE